MDKNAICIIGPPGTGKTFLASEIVDSDRSKILQMDDIEFLFFQEHNRMPNKEEWIMLLKECLKRQYLVTEGFYYESIEPRLAVSDIIIYYNAGTIRCVLRAIKRGFFNLFTTTSVHEMTRRNYWERLKYYFSPHIYLRIINFNKKYKSYIEERLKSADMVNKKIYVIRTIREAREVVDNIKQLLGSVLVT